MFKWIKVMSLWLFIKKNRNMGLKYVKMMVTALDEISKITKTDKDNIAIKRIQEVLEPILKDLPGKTVEKAINAVNQHKKTFNIDFNESEGLSAGIGINF